MSIEPDQTRTIRSTNDVLAEVVRDHQEVKQLLADVDAARGEAKRDAFKRLVRKLAVHETAEEMVVHPLARSVAGGNEIVEQRLEEEAAARKALGQLEKLDITSTEFRDVFATLKRDILAHAESEERDEHPLIDAAVPEERLRCLVAVYRAAEKTAPPHPYAGGHSSDTGGILLGPLASIIDRTREAIGEALKMSDE